MKKFSLLTGAVLFVSLLAPLAIPLVHAAPSPTFTSKKDGYAVYLPGTPTLASRRVPAMGQSMVNYASLRKPPLSYVIIPLKLPGTLSAAKTNQFLDGMQRGFTQSSAAKLISSKKISLRGAPGREILVKVGANFMRARFFVKGSRSYQVVAISPQSGDAKYLPQVTQVLNSFRILG